MPTVDNYVLYEISVDETAMHAISSMIHLHNQDLRRLQKLICFQRIYLHPRDARVQQRPRRGNGPAAGC